MGKKIDLIVLCAFSLITLVVAVDFLFQQYVGMNGIGHLQKEGVLEGSAKGYRNIKSVCTLIDMVLYGGGAVYFESDTPPKIAKKYEVGYTLQNPQIPASTIPFDSEVSCRDFHYGTYGWCKLHYLGSSRYVLQWGDAATAPSF